MKAEDWIGLEAPLPRAHDQISEVEAALGKLLACIAQEHLREIVEEHRTAILQQNHRISNPDDRSKLELVMIVRGNHLDGQWNYLTWSGESGKSRLHRKSLPKGREILRVSKTQFERYAQPWELPRVLRVEEELAYVRNMARSVVKHLYTLSGTRKMSEHYHVRYLGEIVRKKSAVKNEDNMEGDE